MIKEKNSQYTPEIYTKLTGEGLKRSWNRALASKGIGYLTSKEADEDFDYWIERMTRFYKNVGWDSKLIRLLINFN